MLCEYSIYAQLKAVIGMLHKVVDSVGQVVNDSQRSLVSFKLVPRQESTTKLCTGGYLKVVLSNDYRFDGFRFYNRLSVSKFKNR